MVQMKWNKFIQMRKWFLSVSILSVLFELTATAQIPRTLQIAITNDTVTVSSQTSPGYFIGQFETTTNLSPPSVWTVHSTNFEVGESGSFSVTNSQTFFRLWQDWPVFQFAIFYNLNMEIDPGQPMVINGPVFCNAGIWASAPALTFNSTVDAVGQVFTNATDPFATGWTNGVAPTFTLSGQPVSGNGSLNIPTFNNTNAESILNIPPVGLGAVRLGSGIAYVPSNQVYLYNESDLIISNAAYGTNGYAASAALGTTVDFRTNFTVWFQDPKNAPEYLTLLPNDLILLKRTSGTNATNYAATNILYKGYSFLTNVTFYDYRESKSVQAVQIDISKFNRWLTNAIPTNIVSANGTINTDQGPILNAQLVNYVGHGFCSIYVYNGVPLTGTQLPAVRLINGAQLPSANPGLTVSTPQPLYIYGNYNVQTNSGANDLGTNRTTHTYPAAVLADAVTILSVDWDDTYTNENPTGANGPDDTTVNAAALEGIVQTDPTITADYSGGVENFLRLLEDWNTSESHSGRSVLTYNGSIVVMFPSIYATNRWVTTPAHYGVPTRHWAFDLNFKTAAGLPPLTPGVMNFVSP
jgi:hypothetical protein